MGKYDKNMVLHTIHNMLHTEPKNLKLKYLYVTRSYVIQRDMVPERVPVVNVWVTVCVVIDVVMTAQVKKVCGVSACWVTICGVITALMTTRVSACEASACGVSACGASACGVSACGVSACGVTA